MIKVEIKFNEFIFLFISKKTMEFYYLINVHFNVLDFLIFFLNQHYEFITFLINFMLNLSFNNFPDQFFYILLMVYITNYHYFIFYSLFLRDFILKILKFKDCVLFAYFDKVIM
jgi:hypothetical protein